MFMVQENEAQKERLEKMYKLLTHIFGAVTAGMKFIGNIDADYLEDYLRMVKRIQNQKNINPDLFAFLRLHVAFKEDYTFCKIFNTKFLLAKNYSQEQLDEVISDVALVPFDVKHKALAEHALKALYKSREVTQNDFDALYEMGWSQKDVFDAIEHTGTLFRNGRIMLAYSRKG
jgi:hypothetical protein